MLHQCVLDVMPKPCSNNSTSFVSVAGHALPPLPPPPPPQNSPAIRVSVSPQLGRGKGGADERLALFWTQHHQRPTPGLSCHLSSLLIHGLIVQVDLVKLFPEHMWLFPSRAYLASGAGSATAWRALFKVLGFTDFIQAPLVALQLTPEQKAASHWAGADLGPLDATGHHTVQDWSADEFRAVVTSLQQHCKDKVALQAHCGHLAHCIDALWEDEFAGCVSVQLGPQFFGKLPVTCFDVSSLSLWKPACQCRPLMPSCSSVRCLLTAQQHARVQSFVGS